MRLYQPAPAGSGNFNDHYAIRETLSRRLLCADMKLSFDQADRLCDVLEGERQRELRLPDPQPQEKAA